MRRTPPISRIGHGIGAGLDRAKDVPALVVGHRAPDADEIRVERRAVLVGVVAVAPGTVRLPELDEGAAHRTAILVEDAAGEVDELAEGAPRSEEHTSEL